VAKITEAEIENRFGFHPATDETRVLHAAVREEVSGLVNFLVSIVPEGREHSLMLTKLQEAAMWANAGIACNLAPLKLGE